ALRRGALSCVRRVARLQRAGLRGRELRGLRLTRGVQRSRAGEPLHVHRGVWSLRRTPPLRRAPGGQPVRGGELRPVCGRWSLRPAPGGQRVRWRTLSCVPLSGGLLRSRDGAAVLVGPLSPPRARRRRVSAACPPPAPVALQLFERTGR